MGDLATWLNSFTLTNIYVGKISEGDFLTIVSFSLVLMMRLSFVCRPTKLFCPT